LLRRQCFRPAIRGRQIRCSSTTDANADIKKRVKSAVRGVGLSSEVRPETWLGDRTENLKDGEKVTWPSEKVTELWKVFFKSGDGYRDVFGVAWPLRSDLPKPSDADIEKARAEAAKNLTNIDGPERRRRILFGAGLTALTVLTMVTAAKLHAHPLERVFLLLPFFLGSAEIASGVSGL